MKSVLRVSFCLCGLELLLISAAAAEPLPLRLDWHPKAPPLPAPAGEVIHVKNVDQLFAAAEKIKPGGTITVADGRYVLPRHLELKTDRVTLRGESGHRDAVVLDGGPSSLGELVWVSKSSGVTIADLTIENARWNGFKINSDMGATRLTIHNCVIHNIWQRGIKGPAVPKEKREHERPSDCRIQYCLFFNDRAKQYSDDPADRADNFGGNYVGGIDAMHAKGWTISDNVFCGIQGRTREGRGAIFLWNDTQDCLIERNVIVDCDCGICLGNSSRGPDTVVHCTRCTVRNNFVTRCPENDILADYTQDCKILHNTIHDPASRFGRLIRLVHDNDGLLVANNLLHGPAIRMESKSLMKIENNLTTDATALFRDAARGDLHLKAALPEGGSVRRLADVPEDFDRQSRKDPTLAGADEPRKAAESAAHSDPSPPLRGRGDGVRGTEKADPAAAEDWVEPMRAVHARFHGKAGTLAQYGDSITVTMAFLGGHAWGDKIDAKNCPADVRADLDLVGKHANRKLWTEWKGPQWGCEGSMKSDWLLAHVEEWQKKMQPEAAVILFGTNDIGQIPPKRYGENLEAALRRMLADGTVPMLTTIPPKSGAEAAAREYRDMELAVARKLQIPVIDYQAEILRRRSTDWDGRLEKFGRLQDTYEVPTLISGDGVHPSNTKQYQNDFSEKALDCNGYNLRNYMTLRAYAQVIRQVLGKGE